jgi:hypothetical protein
MFQATPLLICFRNLRPPTRLPFVQADEESFSEGDESDDVDLTDSSSYDSDGSEWNEGIFFANRVLTTGSPNLLKVPSRLWNILSRSVIPRCLDITAFQLAGLPYGLVTLSLHFE